MKSLERFSNLNRPQHLEDISEEVYDVLVIGGGITGAGIALDATLRGLKVLLVEQNDFASGTSSKSTKLIHGGLRYLKQFDFWLVHEVGTERAVVHKIAPHLVLPEKMVLPLIEGGTYGKWLTSIGLKVYDLLAQVEGEDQRQMLNKNEALELEPLLPDNILHGAGYYAEYRTDDARLVIENLKKAVQKGAKALNYCSVTNLIYENNKVTGAKLFDKVTETDLSIKSKFVVNATGPWVDDIRAIDGSLKGKNLHLTKGVHLVFDHKKLPVKQSVYFDVPDGRMIFAIPRGKITYVGTTDTDYVKDKNAVHVHLADALYLISAVNNMFPSIDLRLEDVVSSWAGLRPLIHEEGKSASELSRKDEIFRSESGLLSIAGGKLTGYRKMAERIVDSLAKSFKADYNKTLNKCSTEKTPLIGNGFNEKLTLPKYKDQLTLKAKELGLNAHHAWYLLTHYGTQSEKILDNFKQVHEQEPECRLVLAEAKFAIEQEMALTPLDFFERRTGRIFFEMQSVIKYQKKVCTLFQKVFSLSEAKKQEYEYEVTKAITRCTTFSDAAD